MGRGTVTVHLPASRVSDYSLEAVAFALGYAVTKKVTDDNAVLIVRLADELAKRPSSTGQSSAWETITTELPEDMVAAIDLLISTTRARVRVKYFKGN